MNSAIATLTGSPGAASHPIVFSGNPVYANGKVVAIAPLDVLLNYVDGLKAAAAQRIHLNPGVTSISDPDARSLGSAPTPAFNLRRESVGAILKQKS